MKSVHTNMKKEIFFVSTCMQSVVKELSELRYSRTRLVKQQHSIKTRLDETDELISHNTREVERVIAQISTSDVLTELKSGNLSVEECLMLLDRTKIWGYMQEDGHKEQLDGVFNANAPNKGITQFFNPPCEWFIEGIKMPMFKAEDKWEITWKYMNAFTPTSLHIDLTEETEEGSGTMKLFGCDTETESLIQCCSLKVHTNLLCFDQYDKYRLSVEGWSSKGWVCQIVLK